MKTKSVVVAGEVFSSNLGDYAIYDSLSRIISSNNIDVVPLDLSFRLNFTENTTKDNSPKKTWRALIPSQLKHHNLIQSILSNALWYTSHRSRANKDWKNIIKNVDAVIIGGGQLLTDSPTNFHHKIALISEIASDMDKPLFIIGCGVGDELGYIAKRNIKKAVNLAEIVLLRDTTSADRLNSFKNNHTHIGVSPDIAFALHSNPNKYSRKVDSKMEVCGLNIMPPNVFSKYDKNLNLSNESLYIKFWSRLALGAAKDNMQIHIMTNGSEMDYQYAKKIYKSLQSLNIDITLLDRPKTPLDLYNQIYNVDYLVTTRMHAGIIGRAFGKSVTTIAWDDKIYGVWREVGQPSVAQNCSIILDNDPWTVVKSAFHSSQQVPMAKLRHQIEESIQYCLKQI